MTSLRASPSDSRKIPEKKTEVHYGEEKTTEVMVRSFDHAIAGCDLCVNCAAPSIILGVDPLRNAILRAKRRGIRLRYITDITSDNVSHCKVLCKMVELRHFDGLKGNFVIMDGNEYLATANLQESKPLPHLIYSNVPEVIMQQQHIFDTLWYKAIPGALKIKQIENKTQDLVHHVGILYLCRECMISFWSKADMNEHGKNSEHTKIIEIPF